MAYLLPRPRHPYTCSYGNDLNIDDSPAARQAAASRARFSIMPTAVRMMSARFARNAADLDAMNFRQRVMVDVSKISLGHHAARFTGYHAARHRSHRPRGIVSCGWRNTRARAAAACGIPFCLSTMSICSIEDVRAATQQPFWFQQYLMRDRGFNQELIDRAAAAQCSALMLTLDLQVIGERRRDPRNGLTIPPRLTLRNAWDIATKPAWAFSVLFGRRRTFGNLVGRIGGSSGINTLAEWTRRNSIHQRIGATSNGYAAAGRGS